MQEQNFVLSEIIRNQVDTFELSASDGAKAQDYVYSIYVYLQNVIHPDLSSINTNLSDLSSIEDNIGYIKNVLYGPATASVTFDQSLYSYINKIYQAVLSGSINISGTNTISTFGYLPLIYGSLTGAGGSAFDLLGNISSATAGTSINTLATNNKLDILDNDVKNLKNLSWHDWKTASDFVAFKSSEDQSVITGQTVSATSPNPSGSYYAQFTGNYVYANTNGMVLDVCVPMYSRSFQKSVTIKSVAYDDNRIIDFWQSFTYYDDYCVHFIIFLLEPPPSTDPINFVFIVESGNWILANNAQGAITKAYIKYIDFTEEDYHVLNMSISQDIEGRNVHAIRQLLTNIENEVASPDMVSAKEESTPQIDEFYDKFTGDGSSAVTVSDISNASDISDSVTSGLSTGQNIDDALGVFNPASAFFGWFSTDNAQYFTVYTPQRSIDNWDNVVWTDDEPVLHNVLEEGIYK